MSVMVAPFGRPVFRVRPDRRSGVCLDVHPSWDDEGGGVLERSPS